MAYSKPNQEWAKWAVKKKIVITPKNIAKGFSQCTKSQRSFNVFMIFFFYVYIYNNCFVRCRIFPNKITHLINIVRRVDVDEMKKNAQMIGIFIDENCPISLSLIFGNAEKNAP